MSKLMRALAIGLNLLTALENFASGAPATLLVAWKGKTYSLTLTQMDNHTQL